MGRLLCLVQCKIRYLMMNLENIEECQSWAVCESCYKISVAHHCQVSSSLGYGQINPANIVYAKLTTRSNRSPRPSLYGTPFHDILIQGHPRISLQQYSQSNHLMAVTIPYPFLRCIFTPRLLPGRIDCHPISTRCVAKQHPPIPTTRSDGIPRPTHMSYAAKVLPFHEANLTTSNCTTRLVTLGNTLSTSQHNPHSPTGRTIWHGQSIHCMLLLPCLQFYNASFTTRSNRLPRLVTIE